MNNSLNKVKLFVVTFLLGVLVLPLSYINTISVEATSKVAQIELIDEETTNTNQSNEEVMLPSVSMDEAMNHLEGKFFDVVKLLQVIGKPFCIIAFIICAILTLLGTFGQSGYVMKGLVGMLICAIAYTCVLFSPQIVNFLSTWLAS